MSTSNPFNPFQPGGPSNAPVLPAPYLRVLQASEASKNAFASNYSSIRPQPTTTTNATAFNYTLNRRSRLGFGASRVSPSQRELMEIEQISQHSLEMLDRTVPPLEDEDEEGEDDENDEEVESDTNPSSSQSPIPTTTLTTTMMEEDETYSRPDTLSPISPSHTHPLVLGLTGSPVPFAATNEVVVPSRTRRSWPETHTQVVTSAAAAASGLIPFVTPLPTKKRARSRTKKRDSTKSAPSKLESAASAAATTTTVTSPTSAFRVKKRPVSQIVSNSEETHSKLSLGLITPSPLTTQLSTQPSFMHDGVLTKTLRFTAKHRTQLTAQLQLHTQLLSQTIWLCSVLPTPRTPLHKLKQPLTSHDVISSKAQQLLEQLLQVSGLQPIQPIQPAHPVHTLTDANQLYLPPTRVSSQVDSHLLTPTRNRSIVDHSIETENADIAQIILDIADSPRTTPPRTAEQTSSAKRRKIGLGTNLTNSKRTRALIHDIMSLPTSPPPASIAPVESDPDVFDQKPCPYGEIIPVDINNKVLPIVRVPALGLVAEPKLQGLPPAPTEAPIQPPLLGGSDEDKENIPQQLLPPIAADTTSPKPLLKVATIERQHGRAVLTLPPAVVQQFWNELVPKYELDPRCLPKLSHERHLWTASEEHLFRMGERLMQNDIARLNTAEAGPIPDTISKDKETLEVVLLTALRRRFLPAKTIPELRSRLEKSQKKEKEMKQRLAKQPQMMIPLPPFPIDSSTQMAPNSPIQASSGQLSPIPHALSPSPTPGSNSSTMSMGLPILLPVTGLRDFTPYELSLVTTGWTEFRDSRNKWSEIASKYLPNWPRKLLAKAWTKYQTNKDKPPKLTPNKSKKRKSLEMDGGEANESGPPSPTRAKRDSRETDHPEPSTPTSTSHSPLSSFNSPAPDSHSTSHMVDDESMASGITVAAGSPGDKVHHLPDLPILTHFTPTSFHTPIMSRPVASITTNQSSEPSTVAASTSQLSTSRSPMIVAPITRPDFSPNKI